MEINENQIGAALVITVSGRLDATNSSELEKLVTERLQGGWNRLIFDMSNLQYVSSAGLRVMALTMKQLSAADGRLALCGLQRPVKMVFDISGMSSYIPIAPSLSEALQSVSPAPSA